MDKEESMMKFAERFLEQFVLSMKDTIQARRAGHKYGSTGATCIDTLVLFVLMFVENFRLAIIFIERAR